MGPGERCTRFQHSEPHFSGASRPTERRLWQLAPGWRHGRRPALGPLRPFQPSKGLARMDLSEPERSVSRRMPAASNRCVPVKHCVDAGCTPRRAVSHRGPWRPVRTRQTGPGPAATSEPKRDAGRRGRVQRYWSGKKFGLVDLRSHDALPKGTCLTLRSQSRRKHGHTA